MAKPASPEFRLADASFRLLAKKSWSELTLVEVARAAKVPLRELRAFAPSKFGLIGLMLARVSDDVAARYKPDRNAQDNRDRVLDVALTWFESLASRKAALRALHEGLARDPLAILGSRDEFIRAGAWLLALAEADGGRVLPLRATAFAALLARTIPVWLDDDAEMTKTMARLDSGLRRMGWLL